MQHSYKQEVDYETKDQFGAREMFSTLAEERSACLPAAEELLDASSDLRSERMMSVKCGRPGEGEQLLFSSRS